MKKTKKANRGQKARLREIEVSQPMDLIHKQACINLEKATQCITQALQHEVGRNQELCMLIRRLEEKEAETGRSLTEQVESNQQLKLKINELQKHLEEKDHSLTQANQTVTFLKNELRDLNLNQDLQSQPSIRTVQDGSEWVQSGESQIRVVLHKIKSPSSPLQPDQLTADDKSLVSEQLISEGQTLLMSPHGPTPLEAPVSAIKEERDERADPRLECTAAEGTDITFEQIQEKGRLPPAHTHRRRKEDTTTALSVAKPFEFRLRCRSTRKHTKRKASRTTVFLLPQIHTHRRRKGPTTTALSVAKPFEFCLRCRSTRKHTKRKARLDISGITHTFTQKRDHTAVRRVARPSLVTQALNNTSALTQERSRTTVLTVARASLKKDFLHSTSSLTPQRDRTNALTVAGASLEVETLNSTSSLTPFQRNPSSALNVARV